MNAPFSSRAAELASQHEADVRSVWDLAEFYILHYSGDRNGALARAQREAADTADVIASGGDMLINAAAFDSRTARRDRAQLRTALARALALGAYQPDGVTWAGVHRCTAPHDQCPNQVAAP